MVQIANLNFFNTTFCIKDIKLSLTLRNYNFQYLSYELLFICNRLNRYMNEKSGKAVQVKKNKRVRDKFKH